MPGEKKENEGKGEKLKRWKGRAIKEICIQNGVKKICLKARGDWKNY